MKTPSVNVTEIMAVQEAVDWQAIWIKINPPPFRKCRRKKPMYRSSDYCAKHVNGAIMTVLHDFLTEHCKGMGEKMPENTADYNKCEKDFIKNANSKNTNLCQHGFIFPSAFCMLNLDGQGLHVYNRIQNKKVRKECKAWDSYN